MAGGAAPKRRGTAFEHSVVANLRRAGWPTVVRAYASKGPWDVLAIRTRPLTVAPEISHLFNIRHTPDVWMVQCKVGGYMLPKERTALIEAAAACGATPIMATTTSRRIRYTLVYATLPGPTEEAR